MTSSLIAKFARGLQEGETPFNQLGISAFIQTLLDDANGAAAFNTLGAAGSFGSNGYVKLPNGLIIQWGSTGGGAAAQFFPVVFPSTCLRVVACPLAFGGATQNAAWNTRVTSYDKNGLGVYTQYWSAGGPGWLTAGEGAMYIAIGY